MTVWKDGEYRPDVDDVVSEKLIKETRAKHRAKFKFLQEEGKETENKWRKR